MATGHLSEPTGSETQWPIVIAGGLAVVNGLTKIGSLRGLALTVLGGGLVYYGLDRRQFASTRQSLQSSADVPPQPEIGTEHDEVDEASWESFPASDSPSFSSGKAK